MAVLLTTLSLAAVYTYDAPHEWFVNNPECHNNLQSPIQLSSKGSEAAGAEFLKLWVPRIPVANVTAVSASGPSLAIDMRARGVTLTGEGFWSQYVLQELRYHTPSEHVIEGQRYPVERHLVFYPSDVSQLSGAQKARHPVIILAELYQIDERNADPMITSLSDAKFGVGQTGGQDVGSSTGVITSMQNFKPAFGSSMTDEFFVYPGSLTTPPCDEVVTWMVSRKIHPMTTPQRTLIEQAVQSLAGVATGGHPHPKEASSPRSAGNSRPLQDTNNRTIKRQKFYSQD